MQPRLLLSEKWLGSILKIGWPDLKCGAFRHIDALGSGYTEWRRFKWENWNRVSLSSESICVRCRHQGSCRLPIQSSPAAAAGDPGEQKGAEK